MSRERPPVNEQSQLSIATLSLTPQVRAMLKRNGIRSVADLQAISAGEIILLNKVGIQSLRAVRRALAELGLCLLGDERNVERFAA